MADSGSPPRPTLRDGRYVVLASLGEGSQGTTWDAVDKREGLPVAIKHFDVRGARAWKDVELAEREARVLAVLSHPKLPRYVEHFEENGELYLVMEKIEGTPLSKLRKRGPIAEADVVRLLRDADDVLAYLHSREPAVVHRDLKPSNVIRRPDGSFAFVDFGAVRDRLRPEGGSTVVGTFGYMAPEQFQGRAGPGSDVYAIGATALALLTGEEPEKLPHRGLAIDVEAALAGRASAPLRAALARMLEPDPDRRPTRIAELLGSLEGGPSRRRSAPPDWSGVANLGREIGRGIREQVEREIQASVDRASRHGDPRPRGRRHDRAERRARKREQRELRAVRRREGRSRGAPWLVMLVVILALTMAQVAVAIALHVVVPIILIVLSLFFGRGLRDAARAVSEAGNRAGAAIGRARSVVQGRPPDSERAERVGSGAGPRVDVGPPDRVRVEDAAADASLDDDEDYDDGGHHQAGAPRPRR